MTNDLVATIQRAPDSHFFELWIADGFELIASPQNAGSNQLKVLCLDDKTYNAINALGKGDRIEVTIRIEL